MRAWLLADDVEQAAADLADLAVWMDQVYLRYRDATVPSCWLWHPEVIEELWWLRCAHAAAYQPDTGSWLRVGDWHERQRPGVVRRISRAIGGCELALHLTDPTRPGRLTGASNQVTAPAPAPLTSAGRAGRRRLDRGKGGPGAGPGAAERGRPAQWSAELAMTRRPCDVPGCGRPHYGHGYCRPHHARWCRHGDPRAEVPIATPTSSDYVLSASGAHRRVRATRGTAAGQRCAGCGRAAAVWCYDGGDPAEHVDPHGRRYSLHPDQYRPCCRFCLRQAAVDRRVVSPRARRRPALDVERAARLYAAGTNSRGLAALMAVSLRRTSRAHSGGRGRLLPGRGRVATPCG